MMRRSTEPTPAEGVRRRRRAAVAAGVAGVAVAALGVTLAFGALRDRSGAATPPMPPVQASPPAGTPAATSPTATSPAVFPADECQPAVLAAGSALGIGIPRAARVVPGSAERLVLDAAVQCLRGVIGRAPVLRTQLPIDASRRAAAPDDERAQVAAFAGLLRDYGAPGILSIRAHDFTRCGRRGAPRAEQVGALAAGQSLGRCEFPTPALYAQLFSELRAMVAEFAPDAELHWTAWNEPDHPMFTLLDGLGGAGAARRAGQYWARAAEQVGADRVLAGEFSDRDAPTLLRLRTAFVAGAGQEPPAWAIHPYRDLTAESGGPAIDEQFAAAVAPAPVWLTEVTARLSGRGGLGGDAAAQLAKGTWLRDELARRPVRAILYLLTPPDAPRVAAGDTWDSAIADRQGRARPFVCGLAGLPADACPGNPDSYGD
jgi:hypothetical protein